MLATVVFIIDTQILKMAIPEWWDLSCLCLFPIVFCSQLLLFLSLVSNRVSELQNYWHLGWVILNRRGCPAHCRKFSNIPGLYSWPPPSCDDQKCLQTLQMSPRGQNRPWLRTTKLKYILFAQSEWITHTCSFYCSLNCTYILYTLV